MLCRISTSTARAEAVTRSGTRVHKAASPRLPGQNWSSPEKAHIPPTRPAQRHTHTYHLRVLMAFHSAVPMTLVHLALNLYSGRRKTMRTGPAQRSAVHSPSESEQGARPRVLTLGPDPTPTYPLPPAGQGPTTRAFHAASQSGSSPGSGPTAT